MHQTTLKNLINKTEEPEELLVFKQVIYECAYNEDLRFSQSQIRMLLDFPLREQLTQFQKIKILRVPPG